MHISFKHETIDLKDKNQFPHYLSDYLHFSIPFLNGIYSMNYSTIEKGFSQLNEPEKHFVYQLCLFKKNAYSGHTSVIVHKDLDDFLELFLFHNRYLITQNEIKKVISHDFNSDEKAFLSFFINKDTFHNYINKLHNSHHLSKSSHQVLAAHCFLLYIIADKINFSEPVISDFKKLAIDNKHCMTLIKKFGYEKLFDINTQTVEKTGDTHFVIFSNYLSSLEHKNIMLNIQKIQEKHNLFNSLDFLVTSENKLKFFFEMNLKLKKEHVHDICQWLSQEIHEKGNLLDEELDAFVESKIVINDLHITNSDKRVFRKI